MQQFLCIENLSVKSERLDELLRRTEVELTRRYRKLPGYIASTVAKLGETTVLSLSIWQTHEQAEEALQARNRWMNEDTNIPISSVEHQIGAASFFALTDDLSLRHAALTGVLAFTHR